jgi:metal-sulfur cluster biosynthetic enzyme
MAAYSPRNSKFLRGVRQFLIPSRVCVKAKSDRIDTGMVRAWSRIIMSRTAQHSLDPELLECLLDVTDPKIGLSVVDLGLVYRATRDESGIDVELTLTARSCPLGEMLIEQARERLADCFGDVPRIGVRLVWQPSWKPDLITDRGRELLGLRPKEAA